MSRNRAEIENEVDRQMTGTEQVGLREHMLAYLLFDAGLPVDVTCPKCGGLLTVTPYAEALGVTSRCPCGTCTGEGKGL